MSKVVFTKQEWEIIEHRLDSTDAIAEALTDCCEDESPVVLESYNEVESRVYEISEKGQSEIDWESALDMAILRDAIDGNTAMVDIQDAVACGEITKGKMLRMFKSAYSIQEKTGWQLGSIN